MKKKKTHLGESNIKWICPWKRRELKKVKNNIIHIFHLRGRQMTVLCPPPPTPPPWDKCTSCTQFSHFLPLCCHFRHFWHTCIHCKQNTHELDLDHYACMSVSNHTLPHTPPSFSLSPYQEEGNGVNMWRGGGRDMHSIIEVGLFIYFIYSSSYIIVVFPSFRGLIYYRRTGSWSRSTSRIMTYASNAGLQKWGKEEGKRAGVIFVIYISCHWSDMCSSAVLKVDCYIVHNLQLHSFFTAY